MRRWRALVAPLLLAVLLGSTTLAAPSAFSSTLATSHQVTVTVPTPTTAPPTSEPPTPTAAPTSSSSVGATPTIPPMTPIPTVVLQLSEILSTTAQLAAQQRDAWSLSSPTAPLFVSLGALVLVLGLLLFLIQQVRP